MLLRTALLTALLFSFAFAQTLPSGVTQKASIAGITEYQFPNGLRVLLFPEPSQPKITVNVVYLVGSRHEGYGESGMAHLLEHMNFIKTTNGRDIKTEITSHGANFNGTTSYDRTNYFETFTASDENLRWALGLEADRMVNVRMEKAILDTEMTVVRNEFERGENSVQRVLMERVLSTAYLWHNYGKSTIGSRVDIEKVPIDRLAAFYHKYYQPDNAVVIIAGQFDPTKALNMTAETLGKLPKPTRVLEETYTEEPVQDGERTVELRRVGKGKNLVIAWHAPAMAHPDSAALEVLGEILNGGGNGTGRLPKALVDNKKALNVGMGYEELHDPGFAIVSATLNDEQSLDEAKKAIYETIAGVVKEPPTQDEIDRAKTRDVREMERTMASAQGMAMALTDIVADGDWRLYFLNYDEIKAVKAEDVVRVAKTYFKDSNRTVGVFIPDNEPDRTVVPAAPSLESQLKNFRSSLSVSDGEAFDPSPANIEKHVTRTQTSGGLHLMLLPKTTRNAAVQAVVQLHFGDEQTLLGHGAESQMTASLLMRGTKNKTRQQIQEELDRLNVQMRVTGGGTAGGSIGNVTATIQTTEKNLIPALQLLAEVLKEPAFPENDFEQIRAQMINGIERNRTEPEGLAGEMLQRLISPYPKGDVRYFPSLDERVADLKKLTVDDLNRFHSGFYGASSGEISVVGQFDAAAVKKTTEELFGAWKSKAPYTRIKAKALQARPTNNKIETPDKQNAILQAGTRIPMSDSNPDYPAMLMADYILGGSISARLPDRIRNREGLSYGAGTGFSANSDSEVALFTFYAIANPGNMPKVEADFKEEMAKALRDGFTEKEVAEAKKAYLDERRVGRSQDGSLMRLLATREEYGRTMAWDADLDQKLAALTAADVTNALKRHIEADTFVIIKAGDFKTAGVYQ